MKNRHYSTYIGLPREIYILFTAKVITCMGSFILPLLTLILAQKMGMSKTDTGNFSSLLILTQAPCLLLGGKLIDSVGRKKVMIPCQMLGSVAYLLCGIIQNHTAMIVLIVIGANLFVAASPAYQVMVADLTTPENRKASFSLLYLGMNVGMTISPLIGGLLFKDHLPLLFILDAVTTLISSFLIAVFVKEGKSARQIADTDGQNNLKQNVSVFKVLNTVPILMLFFLFMFIYDFSYSQWGFMIPLQFGDIYGVNGAHFYSIVAAINSFIVITFTPLVTHLTIKIRPLLVIGCGGILYFIAYVVFGFSKSLPMFIAACVIFTFGEIVVTINLGTYIANHSPSAHLGRINSIFMFVRGAAGALGPLVMGHVLFATNYVFSWLSIAVFVLLGSAGVFCLYKNEKDPAEHSTGAA